MDLIMAMKITNHHFLAIILNKNSNTVLDVS